MVASKPVARSLRHAPQKQPGVNTPRLVHTMVRNQLFDVVNDVIWLQIWDPVMDYMWCENSDHDQ